MNMFLHMLLFKVLRIVPTADKPDGGSNFVALPETDIDNDSCEENVRDRTNNIEGISGGETGRVNECGQAVGSIWNSRAQE